MLLNNFHLLIPEIFLTISIVYLLAYGIYLSKLGGRYQMINKIKDLSKIIIIWTGILLSNLNLTNNIMNELFTHDSFILYIKFIVLITTFIIINISKKVHYNITHYEFPILLLISLLGIFLLISANDFLILYLAIETLSLSLYILASIKRNNSFSTEAGLKYFILGALSSGLFLFGSSLIYFSTGLTNLSALSNIIYIGHHDNAILIGSIFVLVSILFKLAAAPFHMWAPDVYEGSPTIITFYFSLVPKISILFLLYKLLFGPFLPLLTPSLQILLLLSGTLSIFVGTFAAIFQNRIVRLIAFSSIAHIGFIIIGLSTGSFSAIYSSFLYILIYLIMTLHSFSFILSVYPSSQHKYFADLLALSKFQPLLAISFALTLLSMAGIPPLAGFFSKFFILLSLIKNNFILIASIIVILSVISSYYYIRIIQFMFFSPSSPLNLLSSISYSSTLPLSLAITLGSSFFFILTFLLFPKPLLFLTFDFLISSL